jgi:ribonuclease E
VAPVAIVSEEPRVAAPAEVVAAHTEETAPVQAEMPEASEPVLQVATPEEVGLVMVATRAASQPEVAVEAPAQPARRRRSDMKAAAAQSAQAAEPLVMVETRNEPQTPAETEATGIERTRRNSVEHGKSEQVADATLVQVETSRPS